MHVNERLETYQVKKKNLRKLEEYLELRFGVRNSVQEGEETKLSRERSREMKTRLYKTYIQRFSKSRQIEVSSQVSRNKASTDATDERCQGRIHQTRLKKFNRSTSCREAIKDPGTFSIDPYNCREGVEIAIRNSLRARQTARCQGGVEIT